MIDPYPWGPATVTYPDWSGNVQMDERMYGDDSIYTLTGVDQDHWTIIGLDIGGGSSGMHEPEVIVVPHDADLSGPKIEAKAIRLHEVDPFEILKVMMNVFAMRIRTRGIAEAEIVITDAGDIPEQEA